MEVVAIHLARVSTFLELQSLDPRGRSTPPEGLNLLGTRYSFAKIPQTVAEMDFQKGAQFLAGRFEDVAIDQLQLFHNGIAIDTRSSTEDSLRVLRDLLKYSETVSGAKLAPARQFFTSQVTFRSKLKLQFTTVR
jgi:hypothetical protein